MTERVKRLTMSVAEAAEELGISVPTAYALTHRADFPALWIGHRVRISRDGLRDWVREQVQNKNAALDAANIQSGRAEKRERKAPFFCLRLYQNGGLNANEYIPCNVGTGLRPGRDLHGSGNAGRRKGGAAWMNKSLAKISGPNFIA